MKISLNWLREFIPLDLNTDQISQILTDIGLEVEGVEEVSSVRGGLEGVVVGKVVSCENHPNADRLNKTLVDIGADDCLKIVCGAPNVKAGQKVPVATIGTWLYDGDNKFKIKKSKIRGEVSEGMICGEDELGLGEDSDGIMILDPDTELGKGLADYINIENDVIFTIGLTPNRSDAMGHIGVARDLKTALNYQGSDIHLCLPQISTFSKIGQGTDISVEVQDSDICPRYSGVTISGLKVGESPLWISKRLQSIGVKSINNVVDVTNYILHETGHPLHAFDVSSIKGNKIIVRKLSSKSKFITLDDVEREISKEDIMICNESGPMCIAGVLGGVSSAVSEDTVEIFLESAYFNPISIRKTSKRHSLNTDASFRFERGCDPDMTIYALKRAALLICDVAGGTISSEITDVYPRKINRPHLTMRYQKLDDIVGIKIDRGVIKSILNDLEIEIIRSTKDSLDLKVPLFRVDVTREIDVIEEILRIYGFNNVPLPSKLNTSIINDTQEVDSESVMRNTSTVLSSNGFLEIMNNSITRSDYSSLIDDLDESNNINIINPLSRDINSMRQSLLFSGLETISYNINRRNINLKLFEFGKIYQKIDNKNKESNSLSVLISGKTSPEIWNKDSKVADFFYLKEYVDLILTKLGISEFTSSPISNYGFSQGLMYKHQEARLVCFGKVHNEVVEKFDIHQDVYYADFDWDAILQIIGNKNVKYIEVSKFPSIRRDLSLLLENSMTFDDLKDIAKRTDDKILKSINLFDVYHGKNVPSGKKSYALSFEFSDSSKTLTDKLVDKVMKRLIDSYEDFGAVVRKD